MLRLLGLLESSLRDFCTANITDHICLLDLQYCNRDAVNIMLMHKASAILMEAFSIIQVSIEDSKSTAHAPLSNTLIAPSPPTR